MKSNSLVIIRFELIFVCGRSRVPLHCFACGYPVVPAPFVEEAIFSPFSGLGTLVKNQLTIGISLAVQWLGLHASGELRSHMPRGQKKKIS